MDLGRVDLNLLYTFHCVVRAGGITAGAKVLGRTQPSITARIRQLETALGARLFEPRGRTVALTAVGEAVAKEASDLVARTRTVFDRARESQGVPSGQLRIGALPTLSAYLLAPALAHFSRSYPDVELDIRASLAGPNLEALRQGQLDMIVSVGPIRGPGIDVETIGSVVPMLALPAKRSAKRTAVSRSELEKLDFIAFSRGLVGDSFFDSVWSFMERNRLDERIRIVVPHIQSMKALVAAGAGVAILPGYTIVEPTLAARPVTGLVTRIPITLATRTTATKVPAVTELLARLRAMRIS